MIIYGALLVQTTELGLMEFDAIRSGLSFSSLVRLSLSTAVVSFTSLMCHMFTYCAELTRHAVFEAKKREVNLL